MGSRLSILLFVIPHRPLPLLEQVETYCVDKANAFYAAYLDYVDYVQVTQSLINFMYLVIISITYFRHLK